MLNVSLAEERKDFLGQCKITASGDGSENKLNTRDEKIKEISYL